MTKKLDEYTKLEHHIDMQAFKESVEELFYEVTDPRVKDNQSYPLSSLLVIMLMAVISGANSILAIYDYAVEKNIYLKNILILMPAQVMASFGGY